MVRQPANKEDGDFTLGHTDRLPGRGPLGRAGGMKSIEIHTERDCLQAHREVVSQLSARAMSLPVGREDDQCTPRVISRTILATAREVQIKASYDSNGAVTKPWSKPTASGVESVCVTPERANVCGPACWRAQANFGFGRLG